MCVGVLCDRLHAMVDNCCFFLASDIDVVNFYRRFVSDAAKIIASLNDLLKGSNKNNPMDRSSKGGF